MDAVALLILGVVFGGAVQAVIAWRDRARASRSASLVIHDALTQALMVTARAQQQHLQVPSFIDFDGYCAAWDAERKVLAATLTPDDYSTVSDAFGSLRRLEKMDTAGHDLNEERFDALHDATRACEHARRVTWRHAEKTTALFRRWATFKRGDLKKSRELRRLDKAWARARRVEQESQPPPD